MRRRARRQPIANINVVPYIDVMLVLLIIFMVTAPLLTQGVQVDLPQTKAQEINENGPEPVVVTVKRKGAYYLNLSDHPDRPMDSKGLKIAIGKILRVRPGAQILVRGDRNASYGEVVAVMALLQEAGADGVGLVTDPLQ